jgi:LPXTG-motif cell wall-anchored protein
MSLENPDNLNPGRNSTYVVDDKVEPRAEPSKVPLIAGTIFAVVGICLLVGLLWLVFRRRKEARDKELGLDCMAHYPRDNGCINVNPWPPPSAQQTVSSRSEAR